MPAGAHVWQIVVMIRLIVLRHVASKQTDRQTDKRRVGYYMTSLARW